MQQIRDAIAGSLEEILVQDFDVEIEHTADLKNGDYASNVAMKAMRLLAKSLDSHVHDVIWNRFKGSNPADLANYLKQKLEGKITGVSKIDVAGPGFMNFTLDSKYLHEMLQEGRAHAEKWGSGTRQSGKTVMVEFTDPNPFKEFHIGHLVPNTLGESTSRLYEFAGATVKRANYQGDVGIHVAKSIFIQLERGIIDPTIQDLATAYPEGSKRYDDDPAAKKAIDELNRKIYEKSDKQVNDLYDKGRALSLAHFEELYKVLGTKFDYYFFESDTGPRGLKIVRAHPDTFEESEGAIIFRGEQHGLHTRVFVNKLGLPTYEAKELGLAEMKRETCDFDLTLTITANEQHEYFRVVMKAMELALPELRGKLAFKTNGLLRFAEGKMSSRLGNIITGEQLLADLAERARERAAESRADDPELLAQQIAVAAIKYQILKQGFGKDIIFDRDRALSMEGDSGPYLQYTHARTHAVVQKAKETGVSSAFDPSAETGDLARLLFRFPEIVQRASEDIEPHHVANYLIAVAAAFNSWYAQEQILDGTPHAAHKVALTDITRITLNNGLWLLGIPAPERM